LDVNAVRSTKTGRIYSSSFDLRTIKNFEDTTLLDKLLKQYQKDIANPISDQEKMIEEPGPCPTRERNMTEPPQPDLPPWLRPRYQEPSRTNPFGDYGSSDLRPVPLDPFSQSPGSQGNLLGPGNPIFNIGPQPGGGLGITGSKPPIRFDPYGPDGILPFEGDPNPNKRLGGPDMDKGPFGGGGFGGTGFGGKSGGGFGGFWGKPF